MLMLTLTLSLALVQVLIMDVASHLWASTGTLVVKIRLILNFILIKMTRHNYGKIVLNFFQVSKIVGCRLERQADLPFTFEDGACNTFLSPTPIVLLCFASMQQGDGNDQACHT